MSFWTFATFILGAATLFGWAALYKERNPVARPLESFGAGTAVLAMLLALSAMATQVRP